MKNTRVSSIVCFTILVLPVLLDEEYWSFQFYNTSITVKNTGDTSITRVLLFYNTSITSMKNTRFHNIVCFTILVLPVLLDEEYWSFQYCVFYNTSITSIAG